MSNPPAPFKMAISPVKSPAEIGSTQHVKVYNMGTQPLHVSMSAREIIRNQQGKCVVSNHPASWAQVSPASLYLAAGQHKTVLLKINSGAAPGQHDLAAFASTPAGQKGQIHVKVSLASQFLVKVPGKPVDTRPPCVSVSQGHAANGGSFLLVFVLVAALLIALVTALAVRARRHGKHETKRR